MYSLQSCSVYSMKVHVLFWKTILPYCYSTPAHGLWWSHTVRNITAHGWTWSNIIAHIICSKLRKLPYTVEHGRTRSYIRPHKVAQNWFLPHTVAQTTIQGRTYEHTVAHGRTNDRTQAHKKSSAARMAYLHYHSNSKKNRAILFSFKFFQTFFHRHIDLPR